LWGVVEGGDIGAPGHGHVATKIAGGKITIEFAGAAARIYLIEASTDLVHWRRIGVARHRGSGRFEFEDSQTIRVPCRYYRVVTP
jgi:hypothetical protein